MKAGPPSSLCTHPTLHLLPRYPSVACEILTSDVPQINDALGADESLLNRLYGFLQSGDSLNPLLASFFSKVMGILINRKTDQVPSDSHVWVRTWEGGVGTPCCDTAYAPSSCPSCARKMTLWSCCCGTSAPRPSWISCCVCLLV